MFHLLNSIGFAHILPISLALFSKIAPRQINATVIGLYYLAFFLANYTVGQTEHEILAEVKRLLAIKAEEELEVPGEVADLRAVET
mgnify:CR=1 FL=1